MRRAVLAGLVATALVAVALALLPADGDDNANGASSKRGAATKPLVVMLVLDEFPVDDIVLPDGRIDSARFPNFAALAGTSTWFPNATSVYDSTFKAVPAILDARLPVPGSAPDIRSHKRSLYTLFDKLGWDVRDTESATAICPRRVCPGAHTRRPGVLLRLAGGGRPARLERWIGTIRPRNRPTLYFQHSLLPHEPWIYLPSGRQSRPRGNDPIEGINKPIGFHDPDLTVHNHMRHLLQAGFVDHELGTLISHLRRAGVFDRAVIAVTADHGYAFEVGVKDRRLVTESNVEQIAPVPLFIKSARQRRGSVNPSYVRTIDVVPTIAGLVRSKVYWPHDGTSAFTRAAQRRHSVSMVTRTFDRTIHVGSRELERRRVARRTEWARLFGTGFESSVRFGSPWAQVYRAGPNAELIGQPVNSIRVPAAGAARIANAELLRDVKPAERLFPTRFTGTLSGGPPGTRRDVAAAVDGRIVAVGRSFYLRGQGTEYFSLMLPEEALHAGRNRVELIEVGSNGSHFRLARV